MDDTLTASAVREHLAAVESIYAAFGSGDIPAILDRLADDICWEHWSDSYAQRADVPEMRPRTGHDGVGGFFALVRDFQITEFAVRDLMASGHQVAAEIVIDARLPNGGRYRDEELHLWTFNDEGKVSRLRHYVDTAKHIAASRGEDTTIG